MMYEEIMAQLGIEIASTDMGSNKRQFLMEVS
jgi:hypothetical protein